MNTLYQQMTNNQSQSLQNNFKQIKQMMNMCKGASNPQQLIMNLANQNPQMKQVINLIQNSGKSPKDLFYEMAQQKGIDPNQIINMLQ